MKQSEIQNKHAPEVQLLHAVQKVARQKQSEVQIDMPEKFNYFTQCISICIEGRNHDLVISLIYFKTTGISFV